MNNSIDLLEKRIADMENILDVEKLIGEHNYVSKQLTDMKHKISEAEKYINSINELINEEDSDTMPCDYDASESSDESDYCELGYTNKEYVRDIEELKKIEMEIGKKDIDIEELMDLYEKSRTITHDIMNYLNNKKLSIISVD